MRLFNSVPISEEQAEEWVKNYNAWRSRQPEHIAEEMTNEEIFNFLKQFHTGMTIFFLFEQEKDICAITETGESIHVKIINHKFYKKVINPKIYYKDVIAWT